MTPGLRLSQIDHCSVLITDVDRSRRFYRDLLGCPEGRSTETWVDFDFFGNQISAHIAAEPPRGAAVGHVDGIEVPIPHFGAILEWEHFYVVARRLEEASVPFIISPRVRFPGQPGEQGLHLVEPFAAGEPGATSSTYGGVRSRTLGTKTIPW